MEIWDAYSKDLEIIENVELVRGQNIPQGMYHLCSGIAIKNLEGKFLLMQRDFSKTDGGKWELSAGGSALKGESPIQSAIREVKEETGLNISNIKEIGIEIIDEYQTIYYKYLAETTDEENSVTLQDGETIAYKWLDFEEINREELSTERLYKVLKEGESYE